MKKISESFGVSTKTIERLRQRFVAKGFEAAINRAKAKKVKIQRLDGEQEAYLVALACSDAPEGQARWTLRLLADKMVELEYVDSISHETIRQVLKKTGRN
jgi:transposase